MFQLSALLEFDMAKVGLVFATPHRQEGDVCHLKETDEQIIETIHSVVIQLQMRKWGGKDKKLF